jgi:formate/nitrite transporter FocA (FNT family)
MWAMILAGNLIGSLFVSVMARGGRVVSEDVQARLSAITLSKVLPFADGAGGWFAAVASGMIGNWLVGMAGFNAMAARTVPAKFVGVAVPVLAFVSMGVLHSPANFGYFNLTLITRVDSRDGALATGWAEIWGTSLIPSILGNMIGAISFVAVPFWTAFSGEGKH